MAYVTTARMRRPPQHFVDYGWPPPALHALRLHPAGELDLVLLEHRIGCHRTVIALRPGSAESGCTRLRRWHTATAHRHHHSARRYEAHHRGERHRLSTTAVAQEEGREVDQVAGLVADHWQLQVVPRPSSGARVRAQCSTQAARQEGYCRRAQRRRRPC